MVRDTVALPRPERAPRVRGLRALLRRVQARPGLRRARCWRRRSTPVRASGSCATPTAACCRWASTARSRTSRAPAASGSGSTARTTPSCAVANTLAAVEAGVTHVQCTANGYGERTGNADLFSVVASLELKLGIKALPEGNLRESKRISHALADITNLPPNTHQAVRGRLVVRAQGRAARLGAEGQRGAVQPHRPAAGRQRHPDPGHRDGRAGDRRAQGPRAGRGHRLGSGRAGPGRRDGQDARVPGLDLRGGRRLLRAGHARRAARRAPALLRRRVVAHDRLTARSTATATAREAIVKVHAEGERIVRVGEGNGPVNALDNALRTRSSRSTRRSPGWSWSTTRSASCPAPRAPTP